MLANTVNDTAANITINEDNFMDYALEKGFGDIHLHTDKQSGMQAIIAIHSTKLGPSLGGCRFIEYPNTFTALYDAMRLARGMSFKAALVGLPLGGGKAVILKPKGQFDRQRYFSQFGEFVENLGGRYITAIDSGSTLDDMDLIGTKTQYVASLSKYNGEPSFCTAQGVLKGIKAAVEFKLGKTDLTGVHVAIQGIGKVGYNLAKYLHELGAKLTLSDVNGQACEIAKKELNATIVPPEETHRVECDVFAPCALGAIINDSTLSELNCAIIAGAANNQLARAYHGEQLHQKGILYATDYVINAGGLIYASSLYHQTAQEEALLQVDKIYHSLMTIFERSEKDNIACSVIADTIAKERLA